MNYTLKRTRTGVADVTQTLAEWGIENPKLNSLQQAAHTFTFTVKGDAFGTATFADGDKLSLSSGGVQFFVGEIEMLPRSASESTREMNFTAYGPWRKLEQRIFCQQWSRPNQAFNQALPNSGTNPFLKLYDTTHVYLGQNIRQIFPGPGTDPVPTTAYLTTGQQIQEVLDYVNRCETYPGDTSKIGDFNVDPLTLTQDLTLRSQQAGVIDVAVEIPIQEDRDITCAQAVQKMLRWSPDAVAFYDYSTSPPTFHIRRASGGVGLEPITLALGDEVVLGCDLSPRYDLQRPAVCILYEKYNTVSGISYNASSRDIWPASATGREPRALVATIQLRGGAVTVTQQDIVTEAIPPDVATGSVLEPDWWVSYNPHLAGLKGTTGTGYFTMGTTGYGLNIFFRDRVLTDTLKNETINQATGLPVGAATPSTLPRRLVSGEIKPWMTQSGATVQWEKATVRGRASYHFPPVAPVTERENYQPRIEEDLLAVNIIATDAQTGTYYNRSVDSFEEPTPTGLAQFLYASLGILHYSGTVELTQVAGLEYILGTAGGTYKTWLGKKLNITGGATEWATMAAVVQGFSVDLTNGSTSLTLGPPEHLGPADLIQLLRLNRERNVMELRSPDGKTSGPGGESVSAIGPPATSNAMANAQSSYSVVGPTYETIAQLAGTPPYKFKIDATTAANSPTDTSPKPRAGAFNVIGAQMGAGVTGTAVDGFHSFISAAERKLVVRLRPGESTEATITLDPSKLTGVNKTAEFRQVSFCENGVYKKAWILMTATEVY